MPICRRLRRCALLLPVTTALSAVLAAGPGDSTGAPVTLDSVTVTASRLEAPAGLSPVTIISAGEIQSSGVGTNVMEVLRRRMPAFSGNGNLGATNASTNATSTYGGSRLALHNQPTLVLLNGRRVATNGASARGGSNFVDLNQIPLGAIERIEVLTDGASAVHGSDAIGGVVNIMLKAPSNSSEAGARYAVSNRDGGYSEKSAWISTGARAGRIGILVSGSVSETSPLMQSDRPFSSVANTTAYSGVVGSAMLAPGVNSPSERVPVGTAGSAANIAALIANGTYVSGVTPLNLASSVTLLTGQKQRSAYTSLDADLAGERLRFFADILYSDSDTKSQLGAQSVTFNGSGSNPQVVPDNAPYNPFTGTGAAASFRYVPAPRIYQNEARLVRITAGLRGRLSPSWDWEAAGMRNDNRLVARIRNVLYSPNLDLAVAGGYDAAGNAVAGGDYSRVYTSFSAPAVPTGLTSAQAAAWLAAQRTPENTVLQPALDPYATSAGINPDSLANVLGVSRADFKSRLDSVDFVLRGKVPGLPAGRISVAAGADHRRESLSGLPDDNSRNTGGTSGRWGGGTLFDPFHASRRVTSGYAEAGIPVAGRGWNLPGVSTLDLSLAYRREHYSDAGNSGAPRFGARWQPFDTQLTVRYSCATAFAAPRLYDLSGPVTLSRSTDLKSLFGLPGTGPWQATQRKGSNPALKPTTSASHSAGLVFAPRRIKGLTFSIDYTEAKIEDMTGTVGAVTILQSVNDLGTASPYAGQVAFNNFPGLESAVGITAPGQVRQFLLANPASNSGLLHVSDTIANMTTARLRTVDFALDYLHALPDDSTVHLGSRATWFVDHQIQMLPTEGLYEYAGFMTSTMGTIPSCRIASTLGWKKHGWDVQLGHSYIPAVDDTGAGGSTYAKSTSLKAMHIDSYMTWDLAVGFTFEFDGRANRVMPVRVCLGVDNLSDELPPVSTQAYSSPNYPSADTATYGAIGRLFYISATVKY